MVQVVSDGLAGSVSSCAAAGFEAPDGSLVAHADLHGLSDRPWNDIVADGRGNAYIGNIGFDFPAGKVARESSLWSPSTAPLGR